MTDEENYKLAESLANKIIERQNKLCNDWYSIPYFDRLVIRLTRRIDIIIKWLNK